MRKISPNKVDSVDPEYNLVEVFSILRDHANRKLWGVRKVPPTILDHFLLSGRFNSVLGLEGFKIFKDKLREVVKSVNADDFGANYINLDEMFEALLDSGVYYLDEYLPDELAELRSDGRWLTAYRYIANNFSHIGYRDFRTIVMRFNDTDGYSFYVDTSDSEFLRHVTENSSLFREVVDLKAALLQLGMKELREIAIHLGVAPAKSIADTVERLLHEDPEKIGPLLPAGKSDRRQLVIIDQELATGGDLSRVDKYLRSLSKVMRNDLVAFINKSRFGSLYRAQGV